MGRSDRLRLVQLLDRFIKEPDWATAGRYLRRHPKLKGSMARCLLRQREARAVRERAPEDADTYRYYRAMLQRCRRLGTERCIREAELAQNELPSLLNDADASLEALEATNADGDLDSAVDGFAAAVNLALPGHAARADALNGLGRARLRCFQRTGASNRADAVS